MSFGFGFGFPKNYAVAAWSPASLFSAGEQGAWYDPSDLTTLFQDSAGTTPVTAVEQPVGLMLDKSKGLVLGPELVTNGSFSTDTSWTKEPGWSITGGQAVFNGNTNSGLIQNIGLTANVVGRVTIVVGSVTSGGLKIQFGYNTGTATITTPGTYTYTLSSGTYPSIYIVSVGTSQFTVSSVSVKQVSGNHAYQTTSANRPVLSARVNLLTKTEALTDAVWTKTAGVVVTDNAALAPNGTMTATTIAFGAFSREVAQSFTATLGATTPTFYVKGTAGQVLNFGSAGVDRSITLTGGWDLATSTLPSGITKFYIGNYMGGANALNIAIWHPDLRPTNTGVNLPAYQRVNTSTDYDTTGFPLYLRCNGTSSAMQTNSIDFTATDKMTVWAGVRKLVDGNYKALAELSNSPGSAGTFWMAAPGGLAPAAGYSFETAGTAAWGAFANSGYPQPTTNVLTGIGNISGDQAILRVNGAQAASSTGDQGTGNYGNYPLYLFARAGTSLWFNGHFYGAVIRGAQSTQAQIEATEAYLNKKTFAY